MVTEFHTKYPGPILLLAGPGTGKTHNLAMRVKWLVENQNVRPDQITLIAFTGEAARNMRERLSDPQRPEVYLPKELQPRTIRTMHSLGQRIITTHLDRFGLQQGFQVITSNALRRILFEDAAQIIGMSRSDGLGADMAKQRGTLGNSDSKSKQIALQYDRILRSCNAIDYDDQIILACQLLRENEALLAECQHSATHLLVDEYQDINGAQFELIQLLAAARPEGLFVVGDDDQSIYGFRGGSPVYIREFSKSFASAKIYSLKLSRRCPPKILHSALSIVKEFNKGRLDKGEPQFSEDNQSDVQIHNVPSDGKEAKMVAAIAAEASPSRDVLILVPSSPFAREIRRALRNIRVAYEFKGATDEGGFGVFQALGDWLASRNDNLALRLVLQKIIDAGTTGVPSAKSRKPEKLSMREAALEEIALLWLKVLGGQGSLFDCLAGSPKEDGQAKALCCCLEQVRSAYSGDLETFAATACRLVQPWGSPKTMLEEIKTWLEELRGRSGLGIETGIRIMTMRLAKGLEADVTIIVGLEHGVFPPQKEVDMAECSRLLYVSMTRAKSELHLFHARKRDARSTFLSESYKLGPSAFLGAIPESYCRRRYTS